MREGEWGRVESDKMGEGERDSMEECESEESGREMVVMVDGSDGYGGECVCGGSQQWRGRFVHPETRLAG